MYDGIDALNDGLRNSLSDAACTFGLALFGPPDAGNVHCAREQSERFDVEYQSLLGQRDNRFHGKSIFFRARLVDVDAPKTMLSARRQRYELLVLDLGKSVDAIAASR